jgi:hypothetical protein
MGMSGRQVWIERRKASSIHTRRQKRLTAKVAKNGREGREETQSSSPTMAQTGEGPSLHNFGWIPLLPGGGSGAYDAAFMTSGTAHKHSIRDKTSLTLACATEASLGHP